MLLFLPFKPNKKYNNILATHVDVAKLTNYKNTIICFLRFLFLQ